MILFLSLLCGLFAAAILADSFFMGGVFFALLPPFYGTLAAAVGVVIAGLEYRARKSRKKRRAPMALLTINAALGIIATGVWLYTLLTGPGGVMA